MNRVCIDCDWKLPIIHTLESMPPRPTRDFVPNITLAESLFGQYVDRNLAPSVPGGLV